MTVCIGAICDGGKSVVVCADRMLSYGPPMNLQAESAVRKIFQLTDSCVLLFSGSVPDGEEICTQTRSAVQAQAHPDIKSIAATAGTVYQRHKMKRAEDTVLRPHLGIDFASFQQLVAQSATSQVLSQMLGMLSQHNLGLDVMIAGTDADGAHLFLVSHPGNVMPMDTVGSASIGSGGMHGAIKMSLAKHTKDNKLAQTIYDVHEAKVASEIAPGVGKATDIAVLNGNGVKFVETKMFSTLHAIHKESPSLDKADLKKLETACKEYDHAPTAL